MESPDLSAQRREYLRGGLSVAAAGTDPGVLLSRWMADAEAAGIGEPNAMVLATASAGAVPSARVVLAKQLDEAGIVFFTNADSRKGRELMANPRAAAVFDWHAIERQVRIEGPVEAMSGAASDAYFRTRPRGAQAGAIASLQSRPIADRAELDQRFDALMASEAPLARPAHWGGFRIGWQTVEFWQGRENRLHDRIVFTRGSGGWSVGRLQP